MNDRRRRSPAAAVGILHFTAPPIVGGVEQLMAIHARLLADHGHAVTVLAGRGGASVPGTTFERIPLLDSKHPAIVRVRDDLARGAVPPDFAELSRALQVELRRAFASLDLCIVHNAFTLHFNLPLTDALFALAAEPGTPRLVAWCHDLSWTNPLYLPILHDGRPWNLLRTAAPGTRYVVVSEDRRTDLSALTGLPSGDVAVIPAGVDAARKLAFHPSTARLVERLRLLEADPFLLLPVRITRRKNIQYALRVVAHLRDDLGLAPTLVVTGPPGPHNVHSGEYVDELLSLRRELSIEEEAIFLFEHRTERGAPLRVSDRMMDDFYRAADLLLFPSEQEGFGIPMLEAGVAALPVFCADIPPFREIAGDAAHFFDLADPPCRTAERIAEYCRDDPTYRLRKRVLRSFTWNELYDERIAPLLEVGDGS